MKRLCHLLLLFALIFSCSSKKNILFLQDIESGDKFNYPFLQHKIKPDDILKIDVSADNIESIRIFQNSIGINSFNSRETISLNGYQVDHEGNINFPSVGKINVIGLTIPQTISKIRELIINAGLMTEISVDVKILNLNFSVIGEVMRPGRYNFDDNNMDIFQALGMAGDLTINGKRDDVKIIREVDNDIEVISLNLTNSEFIKNNNFQIFSGDVIIVNPNNTRVKNAGIIGNSGTLISLLSFLLSSIIVIQN